MATKSMVKAEKVERRGKYKGVKIHLSDEASQLLIDYVDIPTVMKQLQIEILCIDIGKKIVALKNEYPNLLVDRTPEEIKTELENEFESAQKKLEAIAAKKDWKQVKVPLKSVSQCKEQVG